MVSETEERTQAGRREELYCSCLAGPFATLSNLRQHEATQVHQKRLEKVADWTVPKEPAGHYTETALTSPSSMLAPDLQAIVDAVKETRQQRAKMARLAFSLRGWPNAEHPGTVRDFLVEHHIPIEDDGARLKE